MRDDRVNQILADFFRGGGPEQREWTRAEVGKLGFRCGGLYSGTPSIPLSEGSTTPSLEYLASVGYLRKGKRGSRAVYSRGPEEMIRRPDLPDGWLWEHVHNYGRGTYWVAILTDTYKARGGALTLLPLVHADRPELVGMLLGNRSQVEANGNRWGGFQYGQRVLQEWDRETEQWIRKAARLPRIGIGGFDAIEGEKTLPVYLFADIRDREALIALRDLARERDIAQYRAETR